MPLISILVPILNKHSPIQKRSSETAVAFLYLPEPPPETEAEFYLDSLTALTDNWPPTLMVRGVSPVTSTTL